MKKILPFFTAIIICLTSVFIPVRAEDGVDSGFDVDFDNFNSKSTFMVETTTGKTVYTDNPDVQLPMGSLTMIMTYITAIELFPDLENTMLTFTTEMNRMLYGTPVSASGMKAEETYSVLALLNMMMIPSGADAALTLAMGYDALVGVKTEHYGTNSDGDDLRAYDLKGSAFIEKMNEKAKELGLENTHFTNSFGLHDEDHYSSARDVATMCEYAVELPYFTEITSKVMYQTPATELAPDGRSVYNVFPLFSSYLYAGNYRYTVSTGIKSASSDDAGSCIAATATKNNYSYLAIVLGGATEDEFGQPVSGNQSCYEAIRLFNWAFNSLMVKTVLTEGDLVSEVPVKYCWGADKVQLVSKQNIAGLSLKSVKTSNLDIKLDIPDYIEAPVNKGDVIGSAKIYYDGNHLTTVDVVAKESLGRSELLFLWDMIVKFVTNPQTWWTLLAIVLIFLIFTAYMRRRNRIIKRRKKREEERKMRNM